MSGAWLFAAGLCAGASLRGGLWFLLLLPAAGFALLAFRPGVARKRAPSVPAGKGTGSLPLVGKESVEEEGNYETRAFLMGDLAAMKSPTGKHATPRPGPSAGPAQEAPKVEAQTRETRRQALRDLEESLDSAILDGLMVLKAALPGGHTYGVLFPGKTDGLYLRAWITDSRSLIEGVTLHSNQGLVGQLLKDGVKRVLEGDIPGDSTRLHYYSGDEGVRSLAGVPIVVQGARRGAVFADSLSPNAFDAASIERLEGMAHLLGQMAYQAYLAFEYDVHKEQLAGLASYQRRFLQSMSVENIVTHALRYMEECLEGDRYLVVARQERGSDALRVVSGAGEGAEGFQDMEFGLGESGLLALVFGKEQVVNRSFAGAADGPRLSPRENPRLRMAGLLAVPVPTDQGVDMALLVESRRARRFSDHQQELLSMIARAAGFALSRARLYQEKETLASRDGLTGVENHRTFQERFQGEILRAQRYSHQLAVLMMDIDFFKKVNDTHGHPVGDIVLKDVAGIIAQNIRAGTDLLARYGGEEFVCMLADTDRARAGETAERIRRSVGEKAFEAAGIRFQVTMSIGAAMYPADSRHGREILEKADKALYRAKETGRNQVVFYN